MDANDIIFTATMTSRNVFITLLEGTPNTSGRQHIITTHPEMKGKIEAVKYAIENADIAYMDKIHVDRERLYCLGADVTCPNHYVKVIVAYENETSGTVISAWRTDTISPGEGTINYVKNRK